MTAGRRYNCTRTNESAGDPVARDARAAEARRLAHFSWADPRRTPRTLIVRTLVDFLPLIRALGRREAIRFHNGYRTAKWSYRTLYERLTAIVAYLDGKAITKGDRVLLWGENRPEWVAVFWACVARGVEVVPIDFHSSAQLVERIQEQVGARLVVHGDRTAPDSLAVDRLSLREVARLAGEAEFEPSGISPDDVVEIIFTSGTTGEPKGVIHRHRNLCANLGVIQKEIDRFRTPIRLVRPIRVLNLLPLSHVFGQAIGVYIPVLLEGAAVFTTQLRPGAVIETLRRERVSVLAAVPAVLRSLRAEACRHFDIPYDPRGGGGLAGAAQAWWRYRHIHRALGWKFWAMVVGGAALDEGLERFWGRLGVAVVQGYGLTEASSVVALNHPFSARRGSIGQAVRGQQVKIGPGGEILVRSEAVVSEYFEHGRVVSAGLDNGWLHTGDIGEIDEQGRIFYKGRMKEVIVTAEGMNVYPDDVERVLNQLPEVVDCAVVPAVAEGGEQVHAVLLPAGAAVEVAEVVRRANRALEAHQRIQSWSLWRAAELPRTASTGKLKRAEIARRIMPGGAAVPQGDQPAEAVGVRSAIASLKGALAEDLPVDARLGEDLGLSSLDRVELMSQLEEPAGVELDEADFASARTIGELESVLRQARDETRVASSRVDEPARRLTVHGGEPDRPGRERQVDASFEPGLPRWNRGFFVRWLRNAALRGLALPMFRQMLVRFHVEGLEHLAGVDGPVLFAANHNSHFDVIAILAALPPRLRRRLAPAMSQDYFIAYWDWRHTKPIELLRRTVQYYLACFLVNAYPLPRRMTGTRRALRYTGELADEGFCPLVFPEGQRSPNGIIRRFESGIGLMALKLELPVVPVYLEGLHEIYSVHHEWPEPGSVRVKFGAPLDLSRSADYQAAGEEVERAVRELEAAVSP